MATDWWNRLAARVLLRNGGHQRTAAVSDSETIVGFQERGEPVGLPLPGLDDSNQHQLTVGQSGSGKTILLVLLLLGRYMSLRERLPAERRPAIVLVVPKLDIAIHLLGAFIHEYRQRQLPLEELADNFRWIDFFASCPGAPVPFNLARLDYPHGDDVFSLFMASQVGALSTSMGEASYGTGARQLDEFMKLILAARRIEHDDKTLLLAQDAAQAGSAGRRLLARITSCPRARVALEAVEPNPELMASVSSRLGIALALTDQMEAMQAAKACINFDDITAPSRISVLSVADAPFDGLRKFYCRVSAGLLFTHLLARPSPWTKHHVQVCVDEAQLALPSLDSLVVEALETGRSKGFSLIAATQGLEGLERGSVTLAKVLLTNVPRIICGRQNAANSAALAKSITKRRGVDEDLGSIRRRFEASVANLDSREFYLLEAGARTRFRSLDAPLDDWSAALNDHKQLVQQIKTRFHVPAEGPRRLLSELARDADSKPTEQRDPSLGPALPKARWG